MARCSAWSVSFAAAGRVGEDWNWLYPLKAIVTFALVMIGWVFFRAADLPQSVQILPPDVSRRARTSTAWLIGTSN
jgi:D-alanyl-lipoteichoic acid acyltransferase DltB (MBOAT superfamily)